MKRDLKAVPPLLIIALLLFSAVTLLALPSIRSQFPAASAATSELGISIDVGGIQFPGETTVFALAITANGVLVTPDSITTTLYLPNDTGTVALTPVALSTGVYEVSYAIPTTATYGFYVLLVSATYQSGAFVGTAVKGFQISQGMANNQNEIIASISSLSSQVSQVESNILQYIATSLGVSNDSSVATELNQVMNFQNQTMASMSSISSQLSQSESNILQYVGTNIGSVNTTLSSLSSKVTSIGTQLTGLQTTLGSQLTGVQTTLGNQLTTLGTTLGTVQTTLGNQLTSVQSTLGSQITSIKNTVNTQVVNYEYAILAVAILALIISALSMFLRRKL